MNSRLTALFGCSAFFTACSATAPVTTTAVVPQPSAQPPSDHNTMFQKVQPPQGGDPDVEDPNTFQSLVEIIKRTMPTANSGSAVAVRFLNTETGYRYSSGFVSDVGFEPFPNFPGESIAIATSEAGETFSIVVAKLIPGHFECKKDNFALEFAAKGVTGTDAKASWSDNEGGGCELDIYEGNAPGDFQGKVSGKLVSNDGGTVFTLESGYFYARRPNVAPAPAPAPPPATK